MTGREIYQEINNLEIEISELNVVIEELYDLHFEKILDTISKLKEEKCKLLAIAENKCFDNVPCNRKKSVEREGY